MWMSSISWKRCVLATCAVVAGAACDLVAQTGQTLMVGNQGTVLGSGGNAQTAPLPAVRVQIGANVVVDDASVLGGGIVVSDAGQQRFQMAGAGISSLSGNANIRVQRGLVSGGPILIQTPVASFDRPAPGIDAVGSFVEVNGGTIRGGSIVSQVGAIPGGTAQAPNLPAPAISASGGTLRITGGTFMAGALDPADPGRTPLSVFASNARVDVLGGTFSSAFGTIDSRTRVSGGIFEFLVFLNTNANSCSEVRGGQFLALAIQGGRLIVAGTGLALTPTQQPGASVLTGTLESGQAVNVPVVQQNGGVVQLVASRATGCP